MPADKSVLEELRRINSSILEIRHSISVEHRLTKLEEKATSYEALKQNMTYMIVAVLGLILAQLIGITFRLPNFI